jgi:hypothetical protein
MKKRIITGGVFTIILLLLSATTAVPQMHSTSIMNVLNKFENNDILIENNVEKLFKKFEIGSVDISLRGNISKLIDFLIRFLDFIIKISVFIAKILNLVYWVYNIVSQLNYIISTIIEIIEFIQNLFNPKSLTING